MGRPSDDRPVYRSENPRLRPGYGSVESVPSSTPSYYNQAANQNQAPDPEGSIFPHPQGRPELNRGRNAEGMQQFEFDDAAHADAVRLDLVLLRFDLVLFMFDLVLLRFDLVLLMFDLLL